MNIKKNFNAFTLIEMIMTLVIAAIFSIGMGFVFVSGSKDLNREEVIFDIKNYATNSLEIISEKMRTAETIQINTILGSTIITITNGDNQTTVYSVTDNMIYENSNPMKLSGYHWLMNDQNLYESTITMICNNNILSQSESNDLNLQNNTYDLEILINLESEIDEDYEISYKAHNRIFAINQFVQSL